MNGFLALFAVCLALPAALAEALPGSVPRSGGESDTLRLLLAPPRSQAQGEVRLLDVSRGAEPRAGPGGFPFSAGRDWPLQRLLDSLEGPALLEFTAGRFPLDPVDFSDSLCGNCEDPGTPAAATRGLLLTGRSLALRGASPDSTVFVTQAGYGLFFEGCRDCALEDLALTGGVRDPDENATDAAVVVRESEVTIRRCRIFDNLGDPETVRETVVGVMGIAGRESARITVEDCLIRRNSWDGIALYRGAAAIIRDCVIDGVDRAVGAQTGGGRGVGIGLTWDSRALLEGNLVRRYWKGIGVFVEAQAVIQRNIVEEVLTWGLALWDAGKGHPRAWITENAIYDTGACGASITLGEADGCPAAEAGFPYDGVDQGIFQAAPGGEFRRNLLVGTGRDERYDSPERYCFQEALAEHEVPENFPIEDNVYHDNREVADEGAGTLPGEHDLDRERFKTEAATLLDGLALNPALKGSLFLRDFR